MPGVGWGRGGRDPGGRSWEDSAVRRPPTPTNLPDIPREPFPPMVPGLVPDGAGGAQGSLPVRSPTPGAPARPRLQYHRPREVREPQAQIIGWAALSGTRPLGSQLCRRLLWTLVAKSGSSGLGMPIDEGSDDNDNRSEFQWSVFVGRLFFANLSILLLLINLQNKLVIWGLTPHFIDVET